MTIVYLEGDGGICELYALRPQLPVFREKGSMQGFAMLHSTRAEFRLFRRAPPPPSPPPPSLFSPPRDLS